MGGERILIACNADELRRDVARHLRCAQESYDIVQVGELGGITIHMRPPRPDLVILACSFCVSGDTGLAPCRRLRSHYPEGTFGILVITTGLPAGEGCRAGRAGADACLRAEGLSRLRLQDAARSVLTEVCARRGGRLEVGSLTLVRGERLLLMGSEKIKLSRLEFAILWRLAEAPGALVRAAELQLDWDEDARSTQQLRKRVSRLRIKLGAARGLIQTVWGEGYVLDLEHAQLR